MSGSKQKLVSDQAHVFRVRVYYEDTDAAGIVYYANYLRFAERARTEMLRSVNINQSTMLENSGVRFVVRNCSIEYLTPARLDDELEVYTRVLEIRGASLLARQIIRGDGQVMASLNLRIACTDQHGYPRRLPADVRSALVPYLRIGQGVCSDGGY